MGENVEDAVRFEVERPAAVGHDGVFVLVGFHRNAIDGLFEQIDRGRGVEGEEFLAHRGGEARIDVVEGEHDIDRLGREARRDRAEPGQIEAEKAARKNEIVAQEIETAEQALVVGDERLVFVEADLAQHFVAAPDDDGIAEGVEKAEIDASAMREHLFVERDRVGFMAEQCECADP